MEYCAYCGDDESRGFNRDHVVPKSIQRKFRKQGRPLPREICGTVWACFPCNIRKGTRMLVPSSWAHLIPILIEHVPGPWRVWDGDPKSPAFREVHV